MARQTLPGVRVGPLDPDATENFGQVSGRTSARHLIRSHAAMYPPDLLRVLSLPRDDERSEVLSLAEVEENVGNDLPDGATLAGAAVRGSRDREQFLTFSYRVESGRVVKAYVEYSADRFPLSVERGDRAVQIADLRKTGFPLTGEGSETDLHVGGAERERLRRENVSLRGELEKLRQNFESGGTGGGKTAEQQRVEDESGGSAPDADGEAPDDDYDDWSLGELRDALSSDDLEDTDDRSVAISRLREKDAEGEGEADGAGNDGEGSDPLAQPFDGYAELTADDVRKHIRAEEDRAVLQAIVDYEKAPSGPGRSTVISAAEQRLDQLANAQAAPGA